jgi:hypothetical protein
MGSTIGYVTYSMDLVDNLAYQVDVKQDTNLNRQSEEFMITDVSVVNNEFNLTLKNTGTIPINITRMWAKNMTDPLFNQTNYEVNQVVAPGQSISNIGQGTGLVAMDSESYSLKLLTTRGNALETQVVSTTNQPLEMSLFTTPSNPLTVQNVTLLYIVKNNLTEGIIQQITPIMNPPVTTGTATADLKEGPTPSTAVGLNPGETAFFKWIYEVAGLQNEQITFEATLANAAPGNSASDTVTIDIAPVAQQSINEIIGGQVGVIALDFDSFEFCDVGAVNCETDQPANWKSAWEATKNKAYLWRMNVTNSGAESILLDKHTALFMIDAAETGGTTPKTFYIKKDSTATNEDPGAYVNYEKSVVAGGVTTTIYFGIEQPGSTTLEKTQNTPSTEMVAISLLIFGYRDEGTPGYQATDPPYSQNLSYKAIRLI